MKSELMLYCSLILSQALETARKDLDFAHDVSLSVSYTSSSWGFAAVRFRRALCSNISIAEVAIASIEAADASLFEILDLYI
jgi:hypothetical protein